MVWSLWDAKQILCSSSVFINGNFCMNTGMFWGIFCTYSTFLIEATDAVIRVLGKQMHKAVSASNTTELKQSLSRLLRRSQAFNTRYTQALRQNGISGHRTIVRAKTLRAKNYSPAGGSNTSCYGEDLFLCNRHITSNFHRELQLL